jgi:hypothetical protein
MVLPDLTSCVLDVESFAHGSKARVCVDVDRYLHQRAGGRSQRVVQGRRLGDSCGEALLQGKSTPYSIHIVHQTLGDLASCICASPAAPHTCQRTSTCICAKTCNLCLLALVQTDEAAVACMLS